MDIERLVASVGVPTAVLFFILFRIDTTLRRLLITVEKSHELLRTIATERREK